MTYQDPLGLSEDQGKFVDVGTKTATDKVEIKHNSGKAIQGIAIVIMLIGMLSSLLFAIMIGGAVSNIPGMEEAGGVLIGVLVFTVGCLLSWIGTRMLKGFGEIVEYTAETATYLEYLCKNIHKEE